MGGMTSTLHNLPTACGIRSRSVGIVIGSWLTNYGGIVAKVTAVGYIVEKGPLWS